MQCLLRCTPRVPFLLSRRYSNPPSLDSIVPLTTRITTLPSGFRVASEDGFGITATVAVWVDVGSVFEDDTTNGVAHFLEHLAFRGTTRRPKRALETEVENLGAYLNAYTTREHTAYFTQCMKEDVPQMVDLLADILQNSLFKRTTLEIERGIIKAEKEAVMKDPNEVLFDYLHMGAFQGTSLGFTILGHDENINRFSKEDIKSYIATHYIAPRMMLVGSGAVNHDETPKFEGSQIPFTPCDIRNPELGPKDSIRFVLGYESVPFSDRDYYTMLVIQSIFGDWDNQRSGGHHVSSVLSQIISPLQSVRSIETFFSPYQQTGVFGFVVQSDPQYVETVLQRLLSSIATLPESLTDSDLSIAKLKVKMSALLPLKGSTPIATDIGRQIMSTGKRLTALEIAERVDSVTKEDVLCCLDHYFNNVYPAVIAIGNTETLPPYSIIQQLTNFDVHKKMF